MELGLCRSSLRGAGEFGEFHALTEEGEDSIRIYGYTKISKFMFYYDGCGVFRGEI